MLPTWQARKPAAENAPPTTVQIIDSLFDFGKVTDGEIVEFSYRFKIQAHSPSSSRTLQQAVADTVPEKPEAPIKPGETGFIKVKFKQ
jgi:hypothetical protein